QYQAVYKPADPDTSPPVVTVDRLLDCASFQQNATESTIGTAATFSFRCDDPGFGSLTGPSGVASCVGRVNGTPVANGSSIDTSTPGDFTLTVTGTDGNGNTLSKTATYHVLADSIKPTLNPSFSPSPPFLEGQTGVTVSPNAVDNESGLASSGCGAVDTSTV